MNSFHQSRGRIFFEAVCALTVSASCAGAWVQTGATALLPASFAAALYGLWHLTDMARRQPRTVVETSDPVHGPDVGQPELSAYAAPAPEVEQEKALVAVGPVFDEPVVEVAPEPAPKPKRKSRKKSPAAELAEAAPESEPPVIEAVPVIDSPTMLEDEHQVPIAPLFEPQPLVRQPRPVFGRKAGFGR